MDRLIPNRRIGCLLAQLKSPNGKPSSKSALIIQRSRILSGEEEY